MFTEHKPLWQQLTTAVHQDRLAHAFILMGMRGIGKSEFARTFVSFLLCQAKPKTNPSCQVCNSCRLIQAGTHPDILEIRSEEEGPIKIDAIRTVNECVNQTALMGGYRVVLIHDAHRLNHYAANALLKTLEEPAPNTLFLLITDQGLRLPPTILSRCQKLTFAKPSWNEAYAWLKAHVTESVDHTLLLKLADGAPKAALAYFNQGDFTLRKTLFEGLHALFLKQMDPIEFAGKVQDTSLSSILNLLWVWLKDLIRYQLTHRVDQLTNSDFQGAIDQMARQIGLSSLIHYQDQILMMNKRLQRGLNLNQRLQLEELFIQWATVC